MDTSFLQADEVVVEKVRKSLIVYIEDVIAHLVGCSVFSIAAVISSRYGDYGAYIAMILTAIVLLFFVSFFYAWTREYFDVWYVTNKHIVAINQKDILHREQVSLEYSRIQDVFFEKNGFLQTFFGFGTLRIQSAGTEQEMVMTGVAHVEMVAKRLIELRDTQKVK
ncbi:MAG: hypothetical protein RLZZ308_398 [Candidatus Parcubacteria bacterium]|jgi:membrane protein YdbS with pleckstrin-like domain